MKNKIITLYGGKEKIEFVPRYHQYIDLKTGQKLVSVTRATSVIDKSAPLIYWAIGLAKDYLIEKAKKGEYIWEEDIEEACKLHYKRKKEAADKGTLVHKWAEQYINNVIKKRAMPKMPEDEQVSNGVLAFLKWVDQHKVTFVASERIVFSRMHNYVGIMDCLAKINGCLCCVDFKTGNRIYPEHRFQVAAYAQAAQEEDEKPFGNSWIIRFGKDDAEFEAVELSEGICKDIKTFLACLQIRRRLNDLKP